MSNATTLISEMSPSIEDGMRRGDHQVFTALFTKPSSNASTTYPDLSVRLVFIPGTMLLPSTGEYQQNDGLWSYCFWIDEVRTDVPLQGGIVIAFSGPDMLRDLQNGVPSGDGSRTLLRLVDMQRVVEFGREHSPAVCLHTIKLSLIWFSHERRINHRISIQSTVPGPRSLFDRSIAPRGPPPAPLDALYWIPECMKWLDEYLTEEFATERQTGPVGDAINILRRGRDTTRKPRIMLMVLRGSTR